MSKLSIRPHHMLCLQFFEGKGYSDDFTHSMMRIKEELETHNNQVDIINGVDMICENCPNKILDKCKNEESVQEHDIRVYDRVKNIVKRSADWQTITQAVKRNIIDAGVMKQVCGDCRWSDICFKK